MDTMVYNRAKRSMLYKVTLKTSCSNRNGVRLEKGANVEIVFNTTSSLFGFSEARKLIQDAFMRKYGIDVEKARAINSADMDVQKLG